MKTLELAKNAVDRLEVAAKWGTPAYKIEFTMATYQLDWNDLERLLNFLFEWFIGVSGMEPKDPKGLPTLLKMIPALNSWDPYGAKFKPAALGLYRVCTVKNATKPFQPGNIYTLKTGPKAMQSFTLTEKAANKFFTDFYKDLDTPKDHSVVLIQKSGYENAKRLFTQYQIISLCEDLVAYKSTPKDLKTLAKNTLRHIEKYSWMLQEVQYVPKPVSVRLVKVYK